MSAELFKVFLDSDILLDVLMKREPFYLSATNIIELSNKREIVSFVSSSCYANVFYVLRRFSNSEKAKSAIKALSNFLNILTVDSRIIQMALDSDLRDFEDAIQYFTAKSHNLKYIITRNIKDYRIDDISVMTAEDFLKII